MTWDKPRAVEPFPRAGCQDNAHPPAGHAGRRAVIAGDRDLIAEPIRWARCALPILRRRLAR